MLTLAFQVLADVATAQAPAPDVINSSLANNQTANPTTSIPADLGTTANPMPPVDYGNTAGVNGYGGPPQAEVSDLGRRTSPPYLTQTDESLTWLTSSGNYVVNRSHPESLSLSGSSDSVLVQGSYFALASGSVTTSPLDSCIVRADSENFDVRYNLTTDGAPSGVVGSMEVVVDFSNWSAPKITATVVQVSDTFANWNVVWMVAPSTGAMFHQPSKGYYYPLSGLPTGFALASSNLSFEVPSVRNTGSSHSFQVDWRDAGCGQASTQSFKTSSGAVTPGFGVAFPTGKATIDPTLVTSMASYTQTASYQRHTFWYDGCYWVFYSLPSGIGYSWSSDGRTWSSGWTVSGSTAQSAACGFDVSMSKGTVAVVWVDTSQQHIYFAKGNILGSKISWSSPYAINTLNALIPEWVGSPSVAIAADGTFWIACQIRSHDTTLWHSMDGVSFTAVWVAPMRSIYWECDALVPVSNGDVVLVETSGSKSGSCTEVGWNYFSASSGIWYPAVWKSWFAQINMVPGDKNNSFSAVAGPDGTVYLLYLENTGPTGGGNYPYLAILRTDGTCSYSQVDTVGVSHLAICMDDSQILHLFYTNYPASEIIHKDSAKPVGPNSMLSLSSWTVSNVVCTLSANVNSLGCSMAPVQFIALDWATNLGSVYFASMPLPYGTPGSSNEPWSRAGVSPYGTYFSTEGDSVSPGSGLLSVQMNLVSVPIRNGLDQGISIMYEAPKYFNAIGGAPLDYYANPDYGLTPVCAMGQGWGLDLPWLTDTYVGLPGGQRYVIQWGNNGNASTFENSNGVHFMLSRSSPSNPTWYDLTLASGQIYEFSGASMVQGSPFNPLIMISDGVGADPCGHSSRYTGTWVAVNTGTVGTGGIGIYSITNPVSQKSINLNYYASGTYVNRLQSIIAPNGAVTSFNYSKGATDGRVLLKNITDPRNRVTEFTYDATANYSLGSITYPTKSKVTYNYGRDLTVGTDIYSWLVTKTVLTSDKGALIRQADFSYQIVSGQVRFVRITDRNETSAIQGYTEYIYRADFSNQAETKKDYSGAQLSKTATWYDSNGMPFRVDTYKGSSQSISYSEYTGYDDWGNVIFTRNALGYESYSSYANTKSENALQGFSTMTKTTSGKIFYDSFDNWDISDWSTNLASGNTVVLDGLADPANAPAMKITQNNYGSAVAYHTFPEQPNDFIIQTSWMTNTFWPTYICAKYGASSTSSGSTRLCFFSSVDNQGIRQFWWQDQSGNHKIGTIYEDNTWYDIGFYIHYSAGTYDVYIDGVKVTGSGNQPLLLGTSGNINAIFFQAGDYGQVTSEWVDDIRIYSGLTVTINGIYSWSGYLAELYDSQGNVISTTKSGTLSVPALSMTFPQGTIRLYKIGCDYIDAPIVDVWGGDVYTFSAGYSSEPIQKTTLGFGGSWNNIGDDTFPGTTVQSPSNDLTWVNDPGASVHGTSYHESGYYFGGEWPGNHWQGFVDGWLMQVPGSNAIVQYVWLTSGRLPQEIALQFEIYTPSGTTYWARAYWGVTDSINSSISGYGYSILYRVGNMPTTTGQWLQLTVNATDLGIDQQTGYYVRGVLYALYGGTARWDFTSRMSIAVLVYGVPTSDTVEFDFDDGTSVSAAGAGVNAAVLWPGSIGKMIYPLSGCFRVMNGASLVYKSPWTANLYNRDGFTFSPVIFYPNEVNGNEHSKLVAHLQFQDAGRSVSQQLYVSYDANGDPIQTKSSLYSVWTYTQAGFDQYGNMLWSTDPSGRRTITDYSSSDGYTYPTDTKQGGLTDTFDLDTSWASTKGGGNGASWMYSGYSNSVSYSPSNSVKLSWANAAPNGTDWGTAMMWKNYQTGTPQTLSVRVFVQTYQHTGFHDTMDSGIKLKLFDSGGKNYANYTYWLVDWYFTNDFKHPSDAYTKQLWNNQTGVWVNETMNPTTDFATFVTDWARCANMTVQIYVYCGYAYGDTLVVYYDDFSIDDFAASSTTMYSYVYSTGHMYYVKDPLGRSTWWTEDVLGRRTNTFYADGSHTSAVYNDKLNTVTLSDQLGHKTMNYYDSLGRLVKVERYASPTAPTNYSYVMYKYNWQDQVLTSRNELGYTTSYSYDFLGRQTKVTNPGASSFSTTTYDNLNSIVTHVDELGHKTAQLYDNLGRHNSTWEYYSANAHYWTNMTYDAAGNLLTVKDANGRYTNMTYDSQNRLTSTKYPDSRYDSATYDRAGRTMMKTDRNGAVTSSTYDSAGNLVKVSNSADTVRYSYDAAGQRTKVASNLGTMTYGYDKRGRVISLVETIGTDSFTTRFGYNADGNGIWTLYPDNMNVSSAYDVFNRLTYVNRTVPTSRQLLKVTYNVDNTIATETFGQSQVTTYNYDQAFKRGWVHSMVTKNGTNTVLSLTYTYDAVGNIKYLNSNSGGNESYTYDALNRLTRAWTNTTKSFGKITYGYDAVGNRLWSLAGTTNTTYTYAGYNQLNKTVAGSTTWFYSYDKEGNQIWKNQSASTRYNYQFNSMNELTQSVKWTYNSQKKTWSSSTVGQYSYDANGMRAKTVEGSYTTEYVYVGHSPLCEKNGTAYTDYIYANGGLKVRLVGGSTYFYFDDALGSPWLVWQSGKTSATFSVKTYKPFGTPIVSTGTEKFGYAGEIRDSAAGTSPGLYYIGARWMDSELGRFISLDPRMGSLSVPQTQNRYVYCDNNPMKFVDPTGLDFWSWLWGVATDTPPMDPTKRPIGDNRQWPWEYTGWWVNLGAAVGTGVFIGAEVGGAILEGITTFGSWLGRRGPAALPNAPEYVPQATKVIAPVQTALGRYGLYFEESPTAAWFGRMNAEYRPYEQTSLGRYGLQFTGNGNLAGFFGRMDAELTPSSWAGGLAANVWGNGAAWTQLARWGAEGLGWAAIGETARYLAETRGGMPSYGA